MLKRFFVDNFRVLSNFELKPSGVAALVGLNGSGKSSVFDAFEVLRSFVVRGAAITEVLTPLSLTAWDSRELQTFELEIEIPSGGSEGILYSYTLQVRHDRAHGTVVVEDEKLMCGAELLYRAFAGDVDLHPDPGSSRPKTTFPFGRLRSFLPMIEARPDNQRIFAFKQWLLATWMFRLHPDRIIPFSKRESDFIDVDGTNFVSWYRMLLQTSPDIAQQLKEDVTPIIPGLENASLPKAGEDRFLQLQCRLGGKAFNTLFGDLSDGQRALFILYAIFRSLAHRASLLFFDEPDNYLADCEIQPWLSRLRHAVADAGQGTLLVISHHPQVIDYLAADQTWFFKRSDGGPVQIRELALSQEAMGKGVSASEWLRSGVLGAN